MKPSQHNWDSEMLSTTDTRGLQTGERKGADTIVRLECLREMTWAIPASKI